MSDLSRPGSLEILLLAARGLSKRQIAARVATSPRPPSSAPWPTSTPRLGRGLLERRGLQGGAPQGLDHHRGGHRARPRGRRPAPGPGLFDLVQERAEVLKAGVLYPVGFVAHADTAAPMPSVRSTSTRHTTLPKSPSGMAPSESLRTSTWGRKPSTWPSRPSSGTSITSAVGAQALQAHRLSPRGTS